MKTTCPAPNAEAGLPAGMHIIDRALQPFSPSVLGVRSVYRDGDGCLLQVEVISGGYADDITEPYDDLDPLGVRQIRGTEAAVLEGTFVTKPVRVAMWSETGETPPCNIHAIVTTGLTSQQFTTLLNGVR
jgi:hypothetical protein